MNATGNKDKPHRAIMKIEFLSFNCVPSEIIYYVHWFAPTAKLSAKCTLHSIHRATFQLNRFSS